MKLETAIVAGAVSAFALIATSGLASAQDLTPQEQALVEAAREEGAVTLINPLFSDRTGQRMGEAFIARYDLGEDFEFNNLRKGTGATVAQVRQEIQAGTFTIDVVMVSAPGFFAAAAERDAFLELDSGYWQDSEKVATEAGQYFNYPYVVTPLAYSFQPVWNSSCEGMEDFDVTSYADTVKAELAGKTISSDITKSFTYTNTVIALSEAGAVDFDQLWDDLKATDPIVEFRSEPKIQMVITCQRPFDMWNLSGRVYQNVIKQPELADVLKIGSYSEGQVMLGNQMAVVDGAAHPNAGKLLVEFLLSKEGADIFVEGEAIYSFREGYEPPEAAAPYLLDLGQTKLIGMDDWVGAQAKFEEVRGAWQDRFQ